MSSPRLNSAAGASSHASAGIRRSRTGVAGRSAVRTGVGSIGRSWEGRADGGRPSPATVDPLLEVGSLGADGGVVSVAGHDDGVGVECGEEALVDRPDDGVEVATREAG